MPNHRNRLGVGDHLKNILAAWGFQKVSGCRCRKYAAKMNRRGPDWCEANIGTVVWWLRLSARKRKLPFLPPVARELIRRAIRLTREGR